MLTRNLLTALSAAMICSCSGNPGSQPTTVVDSTLDEPAANAISECFAYYSRKDTALLQLSISGNRIAGKLSYALFEKDRNNGTLAGTISGDTIMARYTFASEGTESVREVAFLKKGSDWIEGSGEVLDSSGVVIFSNRSKLRFDRGMKFEPAECPPAE